MFGMRRVPVSPAEAAVASHPDDVAALNRWRGACIASLAVCEVVAVDGLILRILGFTLGQVAPFYLASFMLLAFFGPRRPLAELT